MKTTSFRRAPLAIAAALAAAPLSASAQQGYIPAQGTTVVTQQVVGQPVVTSTMPAPSTIGSHQIDRFEAIKQLQADTRSDPNNAANWTILGELAHEVALDVPQGQDDAYYKLSREAYERASALDPNNAGLRSAVQFARDQETNAAAFDAQRRQSVATYLDARRREMAATGINPTILTYGSPAPMVVEGQPVQAAQSTYPGPTYRPYYNPQTQQPYSYNQYANGYNQPATTANGVGVANGAATTNAQPMTLRQYGQQLPGVIINETTRSLTRPR